MKRSARQMKSFVFAVRQAAVATLEAAGRDYWPLQGQIEKGNWQQKKLHMKLSLGEQHRESHNQWNKPSVAPLEVSTF